jgi:transcription-repair coupling factor (superfamily II helicase)
MSLVGLREMSTIETPPPNRLPVHTIICPYDERVIRSALRQELDRGGQVFYLHNRVRTIERVKEKLQALAPKARILTGHGQMDRHELEEVMHAFVRGDADVLVATTIIESGIDIPNANTIFIDRADLFGLADLYQLRGRVGRSGTKAYAYLMLPRGTASLGGTGDARKRLGAMKEYAALGSGFKVAMRDLEIRGAGNLLGLKQSGHIANIGFDLYCQLLRQSVAKLSGTAAGTLVDVVLHTDFLVFSESEHAARPRAVPAYLPASYIAEASFRILAYRNLAECATHKELKSLLANWRDRFGPHPAAVETLAEATALKIAAAAAKISVVELRDDKLMLTRNGSYILVDGKFPRLHAKTGRPRLAAALDLLKGLA